jgi:uncharacterized FlaG/YvyC family protein
MTTFTGIQGGVAPPAPATAPVGSDAAAALSGAAAPATTAADAAATGQELEAAIQALREAVARLPDNAREVQLRHDATDGSYVVEVRDRKSGRLVQAFPPEILLNRYRRSADLLGVLIDRRL